MSDGVCCRRFEKELEREKVASVAGFDHHDRELAHQEASEAAAEGGVSYSFVIL